MLRHTIHRRLLLQALAYMFVVVFLALAIGILWFGSFNTLVAWLGGHPIVVNPSVVQLSDIAVGKEAVASFKVTNISSRAVTILGANTSCGCVSTGDLPCVIGPKETIIISFRIAVYDSDSGSPLQHKAVLYLNVPAPPTVLWMVLRH